MNTNKAMELARGEYLMLCDHDDTLEPDALFEIVKAINDQDADVIYTDETRSAWTDSIILILILNRILICSVSGIIIISVIFCSKKTGGRAGGIFQERI